MDVNEFITHVLTEIADGVRNAQPHYKELGGAVNPNGLTAPVNGLYSIAGKRSGHSEDSNFYISTIEFEIGLTDSSNSGGKTGIGVFLSAISAGTAVNHGNESISVTKVKFSIPVKLPTQGLI